MSKQRKKRKVSRRRATPVKPVRKVNPGDVVLNLVIFALAAICATVGGHCMQLGGRFQNLISN